MTKKGKSRVPDELRVHPWMTASVTHMLDQIVAGESWHDLPILADMLEDADYAGQDVLDGLRRGDEMFEGPWLPHVLRPGLFYSSVALAVAGLEDATELFYKTRQDYDAAWYQVRAGTQSASWIFRAVDAYSRDGRSRCLVPHPLLGNAAAYVDIWTCYEGLTGRPPPDTLTVIGQIDAGTQRRLPFYYSPPRERRS